MGILKTAIEEMHKILLCKVAGVVFAWSEPDKLRVPQEHPELWHVPRGSAVPGSPAGAGCVFWRGRGLCPSLGAAARGPGSLRVPWSES